MRTIRLFGHDINVEEVEEEEKSIMLFGNRIFPFAGQNNNNNQHCDSSTNTPSLPPPNMCSAIQSVQGNEPVYIGWKYVESSDVNVNLSRFLIPTDCCTRLLNCMTPPEIERIENQNDTGLDVSVMDPKGDLHNMKFIRWNSLRRLVFNRGWNNLVANNHLRKGDIVSLWHFRTPYKPCFAINISNN